MTGGPGDSMIDILNSVQSSGLADWVSTRVLFIVVNHFICNCDYFRDILFNQRITILRFCFL